MPYNTYPYQLPPLPFPYDGLEPYIDRQTVHYHYDKHFKGYIDNLNNTLSAYPNLQKYTLEQLLTKSGFYDIELITSINNNGGGVYNHGVYFSMLSPASSGEHKPSGLLLALINKTYGSFDSFKEAFTLKAMDVFGSGYAALVITPLRRLKIVKLANQETTLNNYGKPLLLMDLWEHAYYLKYKNQRIEYINNIWNVISFPELKRIY